MECNKEEAIRAKEIAEKKMHNKDFAGARKIVLKAQQLFPNLENISQMLTVCEVHCSSEHKVLGTEMDWYGILQIDQTADEASMKKQYRKLALLLHPDKNKFPGAEAAFKLIGEAHRLLSDPAKRSVFDMKHRASLKTGPQRQSQPQPSRNNYVKKQPGVANFVSNAPTQFTSMNPHQMKQQQAQPGFPNGQQTFWTVCPFCNIRYQYYRDVVNRALRCQSCSKPFIAYDLDAQGVPSGANNRSYPQQKQVPNQGGQKRGVESTAGNFPSSMGFQGNVGNKQPTSNSFPFPKTGGTGEVGGVPKTKKEGGNGHMEDGKEGKEMPKSEAGNSKEQKSSGNRNRKRGRSSEMESSESCDTRSSMDSEEDEILEENGVHPTGSTGDHYVRRSGRQKQEVKYKEDASDDDDILIKAKRAKGSGSPEASGEKSETVLKGDATTGDPIGCSAVFEEDKNVGKQKGSAPLEESLPNGNAKAEAGKNNGKEAAAVDDKKEGYRVDNESDLSFGDKKKSDPEVLEVPDPEFFDFDRDKKEECFAVDQMWAIYDDLDGMPRFYARIKRVSSTGFKLRITWLQADPEVQDEIEWFKAELPVACGKFKNENTDTIEVISMFSHRVDWEKGTSRGSYTIYPRKGETWAVFKNWNIFWSSNPDNHRKYEYEFVEILSDFTLESGIRVAYLVKVKGFVSLFKQAVKNGMASFLIPANELFRFSHRVPSFRTTGTEREDVPKGYFELDPASLPGDIEEFCEPTDVKVNVENTDVKLNGSSKSPSAKSGNLTPRKSNRCHKKTNEASVNHCEEDKTSFRPDQVKERSHNVPASGKESESTCQTDAKETDLDNGKFASPDNVAGDHSPPSPTSLDPSEIPEAEFHDFEADKSHEMFQPGQIWALYCDLDGLPKYYAQIHRVEFSPDFKLHVKWLDSTRLPKCIQWFDKDMPVSCGMFKLGEVEVFTDIRSFSHHSKGEAPRKKNSLEIYPRKGEVWALYKNFDSEWTHSDLQKCEYDIVEVLAHDGSRTKVLVLEQVNGFETVFKAKKKSGRVIVMDIPRADLITLSHQIPAFRLTEERNGSLRDCWELDPKSIPVCLFRQT